MTDAIPDEIMREALTIARALMARPRMPFDEMAFEVLLSMYHEHMQALRDDKKEWREEIFAALGTFEKMFPGAKALVEKRYPLNREPSHDK